MSEAVHTCKHVINIMAAMGSTKIPFGNFYGEKPKINGLFSEFGRIGCVTKQDKLEKQMTDKTFNAIIVGYADNHTRDTYKLYNPDTKRVVITRDIKLVDWKMVDPA